MVLVHGLLVILDSRRFLSVEVSRWVGPCTMGESRLTSWVETSRQVSRRHGDRPPRCPRQTAGPAEVGMQLAWHHFDEM